ncbi:MAG TPA: carbohydrate ABC transporter permease [Clostridiaceae bacterium]|nr:carbohydrate ABC transporter permease [Clostridiaceae bacterium]
MLLTSFRSTTEILRHSERIWPINWTVAGYIKVFTRAPFFKWFRNSVIITGSVTLAVLFTSTITGFIFAKYQFKYKNTLFFIILASMMVPSQVTMVPSFLIVNWLGLYNKLTALIIPALVSSFGIFLCKQFIEDIPDSLCESAKIDGAADFTIYFRIILPQIRPAIGALAVFTFLGTWNDYLGPLIMLSEVERMTLPLALSFFNSQHSTDINATMSAATLVMLPVTIVFIAFQNQFIKGVSLTGIK